MELNIDILELLLKSTSTCFAVPQLISVAWYNLAGYGMATIYTQEIVSDNRLWNNSCHAHIHRAYSDMCPECSNYRKVVGFTLLLKDTHTNFKHMKFAVKFLTCKI